MKKTIRYIDETLGIQVIINPLAKSYLDRLPLFITETYLLHKTELLNTEIILAELKGKEELSIERTNAWLEPQHIKKISDAYWNFKDADGFATIMNNKDVLENNGNLSLQLYVKQAANTNEHNTQDLIADIKTGQKQINTSLDNLFTQLENIGIEV